MRVRKVTPSGTKYYIHGAGSQLLAEYDEAADGVELVREYIYLGSKLLASASRSVAPPPVGRVTGVSPAPLSAVVGTSVAVTVTGASQACGSVQVDFGDGTVTTYNVPAQTLPLVVTHPYAAAGIYTVIARGQTPCLGTISTPVEVTSGNVVENGDFSQVDGNGIPIGWGIYTQGGAGYWNATSGVFNFYRTAGMSQAVTLQYTGLALPTAAPLELTFRMGNSDTVRKRLTVMIHTPGFDDLALCTFWLAPQQPLKDYAMRSHTTKAWTDATASFYAADVNASGSTGAYQLDDVSLNYRPALSSAKTDCVDPNRPTSGGVQASGFISNGDFAVWPSSAWTLSGQLTYQVANAVLEFFRSGSAPLIAQATGTTMAQDQRMAAVFELGNTSGMRQRVTVTLQSATANASDFTSCVFWLAPGTPRQFYAMATYATLAWANATITVAPTVNGTSPTLEWLQLDTVSLAKITDSILGTECFEPGSFILGGGSSPVPAPEPAALVTVGSVAEPRTASASDLALTFAVEGETDEGARVGGPSPPPAVALALSIAGSGSGTVTSAPAGVNCGGQNVTCTGWFVEGASVTLTPVPDAGTTFAGWFGACTGTGSCVVSMVGAQNVTAVFSGPLTVSFYHLDVLGSVRAVTDASTPYVVLKRNDYFAFGEDPAPMTGDPIRFAGKELDAETALQYFGARYLRNGLGRFTSPDPKPSSAKISDPQSLNRYAYVGNNPLAFVDPDGREKLSITITVGIARPTIQEPITGRTFNGGTKAQHTVTVETDARKSANPELSKSHMVFPTRHLVPDDSLGGDLRVNETRTGSDSSLKEGATRNSDGTVKVNFQGNPGLPFNPLAPGITYNINLTCAGGTCTPTSGKHDGFPGYKIEVTDEAGKTTTVYEYDPYSAGKGLGSLAWPAECKIGAPSECDKGVLIPRPGTIKK